MLSRLTRLCLASISFGITEATPFDQRKKLQIMNVSVIGMAIGGVFRLSFNLLDGNWNFVPFNAALLAGALLALGLIFLKFFQAAITVALFTSALMSISMGWVLNRGAEEYLLLLMLVSTFLFDIRWQRRLYFFAGGAAFVIVKAHLFVPSSGEHSFRTIFACNMAAFILAYGGLLHVFHEIYSNYRREVDQKNAALLNANLAKEKLLSIIAHDLRAPIGNLKGALDGLDQSLITPHQFDILRHDLQQDVDHVHESMENLLTWAMGQLQSMEPHFQPVPLRTAAAQAIDLLSGIAVKKHLTFENRISLTAVGRADPDQIGTVFRNLLSNAVKFTPFGGLILIEAKLEGGERWRLEVRDSGVGMDADCARMLFTSNPHHSTPGTDKEKGLGLGLRICQEFIEKNRGTIWVESTLGVGTSIYFTLSSVSTLEVIGLPREPSIIPSGQSSFRADQSGKRA